MSRALVLSIVLAASAPTATALGESPETLGPAEPYAAPPPSPPPEAYVAQPVPVVVVPAPLAEPIGFGSPVESRHAIYVEGTTLAILNSIGISYAFRPIRGFAISAGFGYGSANGLIVTAKGYGGQLLAHLLLGGPSSHSFELALGGALMRIEGDLIFDETDPTDPVLRILPSAFLGYRYQPLDGGLLVRGGGAWSFGYGIGFSASVGASF